MVGVIKGKLGVFDKNGKRVQLDLRKFEEYKHRPTKVMCLPLDFEGFLRDGRGERKFLPGDFYCENEAGCRFVTTSLYVKVAYRKKRRDR